MIVQVRTAGDAFYETKLAPWSRYLTGEEGDAPQDFEHPLKWLIDQTHERGMEFHAWLNPYRATFDLDTTSLSAEHDFNKHRDWMVRYGKKFYYNPGLPEVQEHLAEIIGEVTAGFEIDAIHFDDYFYPYKISGESFNDSLAFAKYGQDFKSLGDWRRSNVDSLIKKCHDRIKQHKDWVKFGISPFGVWKNNATDPRGSDTKAGQTTYEDLYANPLAWMKEGWIDYLVPQVYWSMNYKPASHKKIVQWWADTTLNTNLYIGNGAYKIRNNSDKAWNKKGELPKQLKFSRTHPQVKGNVIFSAKSLVGQQDDVVKILRHKYYPRPAVNPKGSKKKFRQLDKPLIAFNTLSNSQKEICITNQDSVPRFVLVYKINSALKPNKKVLLKRKYMGSNEWKTCFLTDSGNSYFGVVLQDAYGNESEMSLLSLDQ